MADPTSPAATRLRQPSWTDARLVAGVLMVLLSVVIGSAVVNGADRSARVWAVRRALAAGTTVERADLVARKVRLYGADAARYVDVRRGDPTGRPLTRDLGAGDLLPVSALGDPNAARAARVIGLPMSRAHALGGGVRRGDVVDVVATRKTANGAFTTYAVVRRVRVVDVAKPANGFGAGRNDLVVMVEVAPDLALPVLAALQSAELDLSLVVPGADGPGDVGAKPLVTGAARP
ncbi:MAG: hypothetical protein QOE45_984 [Frankiaceae bacterium]|nr:hypothetical protein [Frankiaceae bacterium]